MVLRRRSSQLRPRSAGTRVRCTAETCYAFCSVDFRLQHGCKQAYSDPQPTHAPIKKPARGRYLGQTDLAYTTTRRYASGDYNAQENLRQRVVRSQLISIGKRSQGQPTKMGKSHVRSGGFWH